MPRVMGPSRDVTHCNAGVARILKRRSKPTRWEFGWKIKNAFKRSKILLKKLISWRKIEKSSTTYQNGTMIELNLYGYHMLFQLN